LHIYLFFWENLHIHLKIDSFHSWLAFKSNQLFHFMYVFAVDSGGNGNTSSSKCAGISLCLSILDSFLWLINVNYVSYIVKLMSLLIIQGKIKGYPVWFDANRVEPFLDENAQPPAACPSIVNAKALSNNIFHPFTWANIVAK